MDVINVHSSNPTVKPKCILCQGLEYESGEDLFQHLSNAHKEECAICRFCNRYFFRSADFDSHTIKHKSRSENVYKCALCPISFFSKRKLVEHQTKHDNFSNYVDGFVLVATSMTVAKETKSYKRKRNTINQDKLMKCMEGVVDDNFVDMSKFIETSDTDENEAKVKRKKSKRKSIPFDALCSIDTETDESVIKDLNSDSHKDRNILINSCDSDIQKTETNEPSLTKENDDSDSNLELAAAKSVTTLSMLACNLCSQMFSNETFLARHLEIHKKRDFKCKYVCKYCSMRYSLPDKLFAHFTKAHKTETPFSCDICDKTYSSKPDFSGHIKSEHSQEGIIKFLPDGSIIYTCKKNVSTLANKSGSADLEDSSVKDKETSELSKSEEVNMGSNVHLETNSCEKDLEANCTAINKQSTERNNDLNNKKNEVKKSKINTGETKIRSSRRLEIKRKTKKKNPKGNSDSSDDDCEHDKEEVSEDFEFLTVQQSLDVTKNTADEKIKPLYEHCDICDVRILAVSMKKHLKRHTGQNRFKCHLCGRKMKNPSKFHYHMKTHFEKDKYLCVCGVKLSTQALLEEHKRKLHTNDASIAKHNFTVIRTVCEKTEANSDPLDSNSIGFKTGRLEGVASQVLMKKSNEKSRIFNVKTSGNVEVKNVIKDLLIKSGMTDNYVSNLGRSQTVGEKVEFQPRSVSVSNDGVRDSMKMNIIIKKITPEEAEAKSKLVIKPVPLNEVKSLKSLFKIQAVPPKPTFPSASVVIRPKVDVQNVNNFHTLEFSAPKRSKNELKTKKTTKKQQANQTKVKKYLKINMDHVINSNEVTEVRLVNSNPLAHLIKEPIRTDGLPRKGKEYDYLSIIQKSLASQFDSLVS